MLEVAASPRIPIAKSARIESTPIHMPTKKNIGSVQNLISNSTGSSQTWNYGVDVKIKATSGVTMPKISETAKPEVKIDWIFYYYFYSSVYFEDSIKSSDFFILSSKCTLIILLTIKIFSNFIVDYVIMQIADVSPLTLTWNYELATLKMSVKNDFIVCPTNNRAHQKNGN